MKTKMKHLWSCFCLISRHSPRQKGSSERKEGMDYKEAGVDIEKGDAFVDWLKEDQAPKPHADKIVDGIGGFASIFRLDYPQMKEPCLVSATDGIGTKLKLAIDMEKYDTLGQDLVAMCANDLICTGAQPLFFLDYFATSHLEMEQAQPFLAGVRKACNESQMALIGGETAEMPGLYQPKDFDCAGFAVGVVDKPKILGANKVKVGNKVIGVNSSGFHSNGFSLLRRIFSSPEDIAKWGEKLLVPTSLYVNLVMDLLKTSDISSIAHITGGGIHNLGRVLPDGLGVSLNEWPLPELVNEVMSRSKKAGQGLTMAKMLETFNCGIGLALVVPENECDSVLEKIKSNGFESYDLGTVDSKTEKIEIPKVWQ